MFDVAPSEFLLVAIVALVVIGPKDLPKALRVLGYWVGRARGVARQFRSGFDSMVREAELAEMEKKWGEENARILAEHPADGPTAATPDAPVPAVDAPDDVTPVDAHEPDLFSQPVMVEKPAAAPAPANSVPADAAPAADGKAPS